MPQSIYDFSAKKIDGGTFDLNQLKGKVVLIVNTASKCGFTGQYKELQELYDKYHQEGLEILGFPCNQFNNQEPGDEEAIKQFCSLNYDVSFPMMAKIEVNGDNTEPLYKYLKSKAKGILGSTSIKWNFTKFLISRDGKIIERYAPLVKPLNFEANIKRLLDEKAE